MKNLKNGQGITLVALIITIIIMLILVGVTVGVALDGGIFNKATNASKQMEEQVIYEDIISSAKTKNNGDIKVKDTFEKVQAKYGDKISNINPNPVTDDTTSVTFDITGERGTYTYTIMTDEIIIGEDSKDKDVFDWESVGLAGVNTLATYEFSGFETTFSDDGIYTCQGNGVFETVDAKDASKFTHTGNTFSYISDSFGNVTISVKDDKHIDFTITGNEDLNIPAGTYTYAIKDEAIGKYVYYNYDGNHESSI